MIGTFNWFPSKSANNIFFNESDQYIRDKVPVSCILQIHQYRITLIRVKTRLREFLRNYGTKKNEGIERARRTAAVDVRRSWTVHQRYEYFVRLGFDNFKFMLKSCIKRFRSRNVCGSDSYIMFLLINTSEVRILFEHLSKIVCSRINRSSRTVESCSYLSLTQFLQIRKTVQNHLDVMFDTKRQKLLEGCDDDENTHLISLTDQNCCICYDNVRNRVLPCCHSFCEGCIDQWIACKFDCPICRIHIGNVADEWIVTDFPDLTDIMVDLRELFESISYENKIC